MQALINSSKQPEPFLSLRGITKQFPGVLANNHIDLDIYQSEIHALLGENGAGKSTLMKILYGFYRLDSGQIFLEGKQVLINSPFDARQIHIGMVFQDLKLIPALTVAENIALFLQDLPLILNHKNINQRINTFSKQYGLIVNPNIPVSQLSIGEQQKVEILKLLLSNARLLILDEPTRVLAPHEIQALFKILNNLRNDGYAIVMITHKLREVLQCADRITVLRDGRVTGQILHADTSEEKLISMMFEKELILQDNHQKRVNYSSLIPVLELKSVETHSEGAITKLHGIDLHINPGEIVGVAGVSGNGQKELGDVALGILQITKGKKYLFGEDFTRQSVQAVRKNGVSFIPENPLIMATVPYMTVLENMALTNTWRYVRKFGLKMDWPKVKSDMQASLSKFGFSFSPDVMVRSLSGGNLQRLIIAREMAHNPHLIIASYLTRGLDVQSAIVTRQALLEARNNGAGVLLISEDLDELFNLSDRLIVLYGGRIVGNFKPAETDIFTVGHLMTGSKE